MMISSSLFLWSLICCQLVGFATSFQNQIPRPINANSRAFRTSDGNHHQYHQVPKYQQHYYSPYWSCLFGTRRQGGQNLEKWNSRYQELSEFYEKHGHLKVECQGSLYNWIRVQRKNKKLLTEEQIQLLEEIGMVWDPRQGGQNLEKWNSRYQELAEFYEQHGHLEAEYQGSLYSWIRVQRKNKKLLTEEQIQLLEEIGMVWDPKRGSSTKSSEKAWMKKYEELAEFYNKHGHLKVNYGDSMYVWMATQRRKRKSEKVGAALTEEQIQLLNQVDFVWDLWTNKYEELAEFYKKHGHLKVEFEGSLYYWMARQRTRRKGSSKGAPLTKEQIQLLDEIGFQWDPRGLEEGLQETG